MDGKVAIITGAASGIGEEAVKLFVENGAFVVAVDIQDELGHQVVASIGSDRVTYHHCDVRDENRLKKLSISLWKNMVNLISCSAMPEY